MDIPAPHVSGWECRIAYTTACWNTCNFRGHIIYGDLNHDPCVLVLEIMTYTGEGENKTPDTVLLQIVDAKDPNKVLKQGQKQGMQAAFEMGLIWLDLELRKGE